MKPYLIQRATFRYNAEKTGIDRILSFDYMGSSEFEWGALPASLKRIRAERDKYRTIDISIKGKTITVFTKDEPDMEYFNWLTEGRLHLKEFSAFDQYIKGEGYFAMKFDFWWDIENDIMFWRKDAGFEADFKKAL